MKKHFIYSLIALTLLTLLILPAELFAQAAPSGGRGLHKILEGLYTEMVKLCLPLIDVARAIAGFGALWYIGYRVWKHIAAAEPIDFFPLFRPFCISLLLTFYPAMLSVMNGILSPMVIATNALVNDSNDAVERMLQERAKSIVGSEEWQSMAGGLGYEDQKEWDKYQQPEEERKDSLTLGKALSFTARIITNAFSFVIKLIVSFFLQILYYAAALCIDVMRTFHLVILAILGPFVLCLSIFDGFQHTLSIWLARYVNVFLWLPIANLFGAMINRIQRGWIQLDINQSAEGAYIGFGATDTAYLIFLIVGIVGYFTIPSIANYIVHASGASTLLSKTNQLVVGGRTAVIGAMTGGSGVAASSMGSMSRDIPGNDQFKSSMADAANSEGYMKDSFQHGKISGKS